MCPPIEKQLGCWEYIIRDRIRTQDFVFPQLLCSVQRPRSEILSTPSASTRTRVSHTLQAFLMQSQTLTDILPKRGPQKKYPQRDREMSQALAQ